MRPKISNAKDVNLMRKGTKASKFETLLTEMKQPIVLAKVKPHPSSGRASSPIIQASTFLSAWAVSLASTFQGK
jgi:hypothetical protein